METAWVYFRSSGDGEPQIVQSSHSTISVVRSTERKGELIVTFPSTLHIEACVATPWQQIHWDARMVNIGGQQIPRERRPLPSATLAVAAPGNQSGLAPHQVRLHFADIDFEENTLTGNVPYQINLVAYGTTPFQVRGKHLYDPSGEQVVLRGVNKMAVYTDEDPTCAAIFPEIRKSGANAVRIVWGTEALVGDDGPVRGATVANLDAAIQNCRANKMIPMVEMHDTTGDWSKLNQVVDYLTRPDVVNVLNKHRKYLLLNIANEPSVPDAEGKETLTVAQFKAGNEAAITRIRQAGIQVPLIIDAAAWGKDLDFFFSNDPAKLNTNARDLMELDGRLLGGAPNLLFSLHAYWYGETPDGIPAPRYLAQKIDEVVALGIPFLIGEFSRNTLRTKEEGCVIETPWQVVLDKCGEHNIGWFAWEWGPGNERVNSNCSIMNMTTNGNFATLQPGWATDVVIDHRYSIRKTSVIPASLR
jgi:mannan endo-1,4-beta-mannosidase